VQFGLILRRIVLLGTPLVLTFLLLFHPSPTTTLRVNSCP
jgi:hypothetical protein